MTYIWWGTYADVSKSTPIASGIGKKDTTNDISIQTKAKLHSDVWILNRWINSKYEELQLLLQDFKLWQGKPIVTIEIEYH